MDVLGVVGVAVGAAGIAGTFLASMWQGNDVRIGFDKMDARLTDIHAHVLDRFIRLEALVGEVRDLVERGRPRDV